MCTLCGQWTKSYSCVAEIIDLAPLLVGFLDARDHTPGERVAPSRILGNSKRSQRLGVGPMTELKV